MTRPMSIERVDEYGQNAVRIAIERSEVLLEVDDLDTVIEHLSVLRATMRPEVPGEPLRTHQYVIEIDASATKTAVMREQPQAPKAPHGFVKYRYGARSAAGRMTALSQAQSAREH